VWGSRLEYAKFAYLLVAAIRRFLQGASFCGQFTRRSTVLFFGVYAPLEKRRASLKKTWLEPCAVRNRGSLVVSRGSGVWIS
jgi:hypothetical protein